MRDVLLAFDRATVRTIDQDGHLNISTSNISKAIVNGYYGSEIPDYEKHGLDATRLYQLLRDPVELAKAASTFTGKPLLLKHVPQTADDHLHEIVVGAIGEATFDAPYLKAPMSVWDNVAIAGIQTGAQRELSCGYRYTADMTPGEYNGVKYDGVMRDILGNHVALVETGRAGPDVFVGDAAPSSKDRFIMPKSSSIKGAAAAGALYVYLKPKIAADQKPDLRTALALLTPKAKWSDVKPSFKSALDAALKGKLAKDADISDVIDMLDQLEGMTDEEVEANTEDDEEEVNGDADPDDDETEEERKKRLAAEAAAAAAKDKKGAKDKQAKDSKPMVTQAALDAAIAASSKKMREDTMAQMRAIAAAEKDVRPFVGDVSGMDSAAAVYKMALDKERVDLTGVPEAAYGALVKLLRKPDEKVAVLPARVAMDAAASKSYSDRFPNANRLKR